MSPDYLASPFIAENELPPLLDSAKSRGLVIFWISVSASLYKETPLVHFQAANDPSRPLDSLPRYKVRQELVRIAELVVRALTPSSNQVAAGPRTRPMSDTRNEISIVLSSVAEASLGTLRLSRSQLMELLHAELASHKILTRIDYECIPRPLSSGVFVLLTKRDSTIVVESVGAHFLPHRKVELWSQLCRAYLDAYKLPFRSDHTVLMQRAEFRRTLRVMGALLEALTKYIYHSKLFDDPRAYPNLHKLKRTAEENYVVAEDLYNRYLDSKSDEVILGRVALALDLITSAVHKVAIEYNIKS